MEPTLETIKEAQEAASKTLHQFKEDNDKRLLELEKLKGTAELDEKVQKQLDEITDSMKESQEFESRLKAVEHANNRPDSVEKAGESTKEMKAAFREFIVKGSGEMPLDFRSYCKSNNIEFPKYVTKDISVNIDPSGGFGVIPEFRDMIVTREFETTPMRQIADVVPINSDAIEFDADNDEADDGGWVAEKATRGNTDTPDREHIRIDANEQFAQPRITQKGLDDIANVEFWLARKVGEKLSRTSNTAYVSGDGDNKPKGFLTYPAWAVPDTYESKAIEQIKSGANAAFKPDGIIELQNSLKEIYQSNAVWLVKRKVFAAIAKLKDDESNYLFNRTLDKTVGRPFDLLSNPVIFADDMPVIGSNSLSLAYGDFRRGYMIVDRLGTRVLRDPFTNKPFILFYTTRRTGGQVINFEAIKIQTLAA